MPRKSPQKPIQSLTPSAAISPGGLLAHDFVGPSWARWRAILKAAWAEPMTADELELFREVADREPPTKPVRELWIVAGRRGGKDSIAAAIATVAALNDYRTYLRTGERATVMCLASDRQQAAIVHRYIGGYFRELPALAPLVVRETDELLELRNNVDVVIASNNLRAPRGRAIAVAIMDEVAYWRGADSASPDTETFAAIEPATLTIPNALIIGISSPYRRSGLLFQKWAKHYGKPGDDVLVVRGTSKMFNPTLPDAVIEARLAADPEAGGAEYLANWRGDIGDFLDIEIVGSAVDNGVAARPPQPGAEYCLHVDASGGRGSSFAAAVAHTEGNRVFIDAIYERQAPFDPQNAVTEVANLARQYRIGTVTGDKYAANFVVGAFAAHGLVYVSSEKDKSALFLESLPLFASGRISLVDNTRLFHQLTTLERHTTKFGRDRVRPPTGSHDDLAVCVAGAAVNAVADGPALLKSGGVFDGAVPMPTRAQAVFSVTVIGADGMVATAFFASNAARLGWSGDEAYLLDCMVGPLGPETLRLIRTRVRELREDIEAPLRHDCSSWASSEFKGHAETFGFEIFDETPREELASLAVRFTSSVLSGNFKVINAIKEKSRTMPMRRRCISGQVNGSRTVRCALLYLKARGWAF